MEKTNGILGSKSIPVFIEFLKHKKFENSRKFSFPSRSESLYSIRRSKRSSATGNPVLKLAILSSSLETNPSLSFWVWNTIIAARCLLILRNGVYLIIEFECSDKGLEHGVIITRQVSTQGRHICSLFVLSSQCSIIIAAAHNISSTKRIVSAVQAKYMIRS